LKKYPSMKNSAAAGGNPSVTYFVCGRKLRLDKDPAELDQSAGGAIERFSAGFMFALDRDEIKGIS
jgi:hypothetical protein